MSYYFTQDYLMDIYLMLIPQRSKRVGVFNVLLECTCANTKIMYLFVKYYNLSISIVCNIQDMVDFDYNISKTVSVTKMTDWS
jgi:hypothetical protein